MTSAHMNGRLGLVGFALSTAAVLMVAGCDRDVQVPPQPTDTTTTDVSVVPTEKSVMPRGPSFTPTINPSPAPATCGHVANGICYR